MDCPRPTNVAGSGAERKERRRLDGTSSSTGTLNAAWGISSSCLDHRTKRLPVEGGNCDHFRVRKPLPRTKLQSIADLFLLWPLFRFLEVLLVSLDIDLRGKLQYPPAVYSEV